MDGFLAVLRLQAGPGDLEQVAPWVERATCDSLGASGRVITYQDASLVFACLLAQTASDSAVQAPPTGPLIYLHGPMTPLGGASAVNAGERTAAEPGLDARLVDFAAAVRDFPTADQGLLRLSGSFHGLIHDPQGGHTQVVTDRLASRPIFCCQVANLLYLSSDIRCLLLLPGMDATLDLEGLVQLVRTQTILEDRTLYRAIRLLPPATILDVDHGAGTIATHQYWALRRLSPFDSEEEAIEGTLQAFRQATRRIVADSEGIGVLLSGGIDSRIILACLAEGTRDRIVETFTFGPERSDEVLVAGRVAEIVAFPWTHLPQEPDAYWKHLPQMVDASNGLYSFVHGHTFQTALVMAGAGLDTALNGWGLDLLHSGSYLPKEHFRFLGRDLYTGRLGPLHDGQAVVDYLFRTLDIVQYGDFGRSLLSGSLRPLWQDSSREALSRIVERAQQRSDVAYDWIDDAMFGFGIAKFRSYPMIAGVRSLLRERNPMFESDVLETYQRLPYRWRFLGPVFRRALLRLNPQLAHLVYNNVKTSPLAPPAFQMLSMQAHAFRRANVARLKVVLERLGLSLPPGQVHGAYPRSVILARQLAAETPLAARVREQLLDGPLVASGVVDGRAVRQALADCRQGRCGCGDTLLVLATLAYWTATYPAVIV